MIRKVRNKRLWRVLSETTGRSFGEYSSLSKAKARLRQIHRFKRKNK